MLPELINDTLLTNSQAVLTVQETSSHNQLLQSEREDLQGKLKLANMKNDDLERALRDYMERVSQYEKKCVDMERDCGHQIDDAAELAEKQNALMMTLEAKIEGLQRDRQVRIAQIQALHQREETMKSRIIAFCDKEQYPLPANITSSTASSSLSDLISYVLDRYCMKNIVGGSRMPPSTAYAMPNANTAVPPSRHQHVPSHMDYGTTELPHRQRSASPPSQSHGAGYASHHHQPQHELLRPIHSTRLSSTQASGYAQRDDPATLLRDSYAAAPSHPSAGHHHQAGQDRLRRSQGNFRDY